MSRVAFLLDIVDSFGEREQALQFAARLAPGEPVFVVTPPVEPHVRGRVAARVYRSRDEALALLDQIDPTLLVCSEYFNLPVELRVAVAVSRFALATMDGTGMGVAINVNPFVEPVAPRAIEIPERMVWLRGCPVNDPGDDTARLFHWSVFPGLARHDGAAARRAWGVAPGARLALMAIAPWALRAALALSEGAHYSLLLERVVAALRAADEDTELIVVAPFTRPPLSAGRVRVRFVEYLARDVYEALLLGCELVISDNVIQASISKAFIAGIPTLVLVNSRAQDGRVYNIFPLRLRFPDGAYQRAIVPVELGDEAGMRARVVSAWRGERPDDAAYRAALDRLRSPAAIVAAIGTGARRQPTDPDVSSRA